MTLLLPFLLMEKEKRFIKRIIHCGMLSNRSREGNHTRFKGFPLQADCHCDGTWCTPQAAQCLEVWSWEWGLQKIITMTEVLQKTWKVLFAKCLFIFSEIIAHVSHAEQTKEIQSQWSNIFTTQKLYNPSSFVLQLWRKVNIGLKKKLQTQCSNLSHSTG